MEENASAPGAVEPPAPSTYEDLASRLDLCLLEPLLAGEALESELRRAAGLGAASVCVWPSEVERAVRRLAGGRTAPAAIVGYPYGASSTAAKLYELRDLLRRGAGEVDFVLNLGHMVSRQFQQVETELLQASRSCHESGVRLRVVFECQLLGEDLKVIASKICKRTEADMVVTASLPGSVSQVPEAARLKLVVKDLCEIAAPASGLEEALELCAAGGARWRSPNPYPILEAWRSRIAAAAASGGQQA
jgi:deoxyribose-phosphate aldolase